MILFKTLWDNFPDKAKMKSACTNKQKDSNKPFENYCAILLSECFINSGIDTNSLSGTKCWSHQGKKHILKAADFANALDKNLPAGFSNKEKILPTSFQSILDGKTGVIYFKDYWQRGKESFESRSGDHIDLWNKNEISGQGMTMRSIYEFFGVVSDLNQSKEVFFWEVK